MDEFGGVAKFRYICVKLRMMSELRYPIGMQTFSKIIEEGYTYVDKTSFIRPLCSRVSSFSLAVPGGSVKVFSFQLFMLTSREDASCFMDLRQTPWILTGLHHRCCTSISMPRITAMTKASKACSTGFCGIMRKYTVDARKN